jgi:hypothetical protein
MPNINLFSGAPIPKDWGFSVKEINDILKAKHPEVEVSEVEVSQRSDGTCSRAWLALNYSHGSGPESVFAKTKGDWLRRMFQLMTGNIFIEGLLFSSDVELPLEHPLVYHAVVDRPRLNDLVIMEDLTLRGAELNDATKKISIENVKSGLSELAKLHSHFWQFNENAFPALNWVRPWKASSSFKLLMKFGCKRGLARLTPYLPEEVVEMGSQSIVQCWSRYLGTVNQGPATLLHGDAHVGNTYTLPRGTVGFFDWGVVRKGHWSFDVGYYIISCLNEEDRRNYEEELIQHYLQSLDLPNTEKPSFKEAWERYRCSPAYGLAIWITTGAEDDYQDPEICQNLSSRFATAFIELETLSALNEISLR